MSRWSARGTGGATVAVVGRPNVGKSTLVNRLAGTKDAIVEEQPGVTRDRSTHRVEWTGHALTIVDTGGWTPGWSPDRGRLDELVSAQAEAATRDADLVLFVVDATVGVTEEDTAAATWLRKLGVPVLVVANKADALPAFELVAEAAALHALGLGDVHAVSALHGRGSGDLLDEVVARLRAAGAFDRPVDIADAVPGVALIGRPNVGKSSLFNLLVGEERVIVDEAPGTTRDAIDTVVETADGRAYRFVDTAGLRRKTGKLAGADYYSEVRTRRALERASVALLLVDASAPIAEWEQKLAREVLDAGRGLVLVLNKWDLVDADRREQLEREQDRLLHFVDFAPRLRISALTGRAVGRLFPLVDEVLAAWGLRVPTAKLNTWLADAVAANPPPLTADHRPLRIRYATQVGVGPPRFKLFTNAPLQAAYLRYLERRLRESFPFTGTPLRLSYGVRAGWQERDR